MAASCTICKPETAPLRYASSQSKYHVFICDSCYEAAKTLTAPALKNRTVDDVINSPVSSSSKGLDIACKYHRAKDDQLNKRLNFLQGLDVAFKDGIHTDIELKPKSGPSIPAHKALLATKSEIFKNMLESDDCKAPASGTISFPELSHDELQSFLEFLYSGFLPNEKASKHALALYLMADKYEIPFLLSSCVSWVVWSLSPSNALDLLEKSENCPNKTLKCYVMKYVLNHWEDIVTSSRYDTFVVENPQLSVEIARALANPKKRAHYAT